jgi:hypothetical protein
MPTAQLNMIMLVDETERLPSDPKEPVTDDR